MSGYRILYHHRIRADDGQAVHVRELVGALRALGHEVRECALVPKADGPEPGPGGGRERGGVWRRLALPRTAVEACEIAYGRHGARMLERAASDFRPDFLYERHALHCDAGLEAARRLGVPLLLEVNSPLCDEMAKLGLLRFPARARRTERRVLGGADHVFTVTEVLRRTLIEAGAPAERTTVVANAAVPDRYGAAQRAAGAARRRARGIPETAFVLGFVGFMRPWHRLDLAVELLARPDLRDTHLLLVGDGPALPDVLERARALGVAERTHAVGAAPGDEVPEWTCAFDAALITAINAYASPLKLFDYLAAGVPVLAPRQSNLEEILADRETGLLFTPDDGAALAAAVRELVLDRARAAHLGAAGRRALLANDWTWEGNARRVVRTFEALRGAAAGAMRA